ncbi:MAG TPA: ABC transporter permease [Dehalococcoidia bacterium]|nr:ABC transporter permease [Dehalococcoidia bacterium]
MTNANASVGSGAVAALAEPEERLAPKRFKTARTFLAHKPLGVFGLAIILLLSFLAIFGRWVAPYGPETRFTVAPQASAPASSTNVDDVSCVTPECTAKAHANAAQPVANTGPSAKHWFGTDSTARDLLTRVILGARRSLGVGLGSLLVGTFLGVVLGGLSAYFGGTFDTVTQRVMDALQAFPPLLFLLLLAAVGQPNIALITAGIGIVATPQISRIARSTVLQVRALPFVEAAQVVGAPDRRILVTHILPNIWAPVIVVFTIGVGAGILAEAALSFLGVAPVGVSWGYMTYEGTQLIKQAPSEAIFAGAAISLAVLGFNIVGDALRDVLDPRLRAR